MTSTIMALMFWAITALMAGFGAYFGSYFKKKGENLATHEDIGKLVDQVRYVIILLGVDCFLAIKTKW